MANAGSILNVLYVASEYSRLSILILNTYISRIFYRFNNGIGEFKFQRIYILKLLE